MTDAHWHYPGLGFDPLPGDPEVVRSLQEDARVFGQRMNDEAKRLRRFAHREGWQGEAADVFAEHLDTLPRDLQRCGDAFSDLALALGNYHHAFTLAKAKAAALEHRAVEARQKMQAADIAFNTPVIQAPDACPPTPDRSALDTAEDALGAILREAHEFADRFDDSPEVQQIAAAIRSFTEFAPDEPRWNMIRRWAGDVFSVTPVGAALNAVHGLINEYAEFFSDLADLMSDVSGFLGLLSIPLVFVPPIGTAMAATVLALAAGTAAIKTSLYVGHARDANGKLYVSGGELALAVGDVALSTAGVGAGAKASQALSKATDGVEKTLAASFAEQLHPNVFQKARQAAIESSEMFAEGGPVTLGKHLLSESKTEWARMGDRGTRWVRGGVGLSIAGPRFTMDGNWGGIQSTCAMPRDFWKFVTDQPDSPDLKVTIGPASTSAAQTSSPTPPSPVMHD